MFPFQTPQKQKEIFVFWCFQGQFKENADQNWINIDLEVIHYYIKLMKYTKLVIKSKQL